MKNIAKQILNVKSSHSNSVLYRLELELTLYDSFSLHYQLSFKKPTRNSLLFSFLKFPPFSKQTNVLYIICIVLLLQICMYIGIIHCVGIAYIHVWWQFRSSQIWIFYSSCFQMIENSKICVILPEVQNEPDVQRKVMRKGVHIKSILMQACVIFYSELEREFNIQYLSGYIFLYPK